MPTIDKVTYSKIYPTAAFMNERVGVEIALNPLDDPMEALKEAKALCDSFNREANPDLYKHNIKPLNADDAALVAEIEGSDTIQKLGRLKGQLNAVTKPYYTEKAKKLTDNFQNHE
jgi:hypothetical protein